MSIVGAAIVGSAVVSGVVANRASSRASDATNRAATQAADATVQSTQLQIEEIRRQFDYQQALLRPFVQNQQRASQAYANLLGYADTPLPGDTASMPAQETVGARTPAATGPVPWNGQGGIRGLIDHTVRNSLAPPTRAGAPAGKIQPDFARPPVDIDGRTGAVIGPRGSSGPFVDPNLDPRTFAGATPGEDPLVQYTGSTGLAAPGGYVNDPRFQFARDTALVGENFEQSPGYAFQLEEMQREIDRKNSAGGNYGGRALMEATRRAQGLAAGDYYNWLSARSADLGRQDAGIVDARRREELDLARNDAAMESYLGRRAADIGRLDSAYYNYLGNLGAASGLGTGVGGAVASSDAAGAGVAGAYAQQGGNLASIYGQAGADRANIALGQGAAYNDIATAGIENFLSARTSGTPIFRRAA